jgi:hypothetical protein
MGQVASLNVSLLIQVETPLTRFLGLNTRCGGRKQGLALGIGVRDLTITSPATDWLDISATNMYCSLLLFPRWSRAKGFLNLWPICLSIDFNYNVPYRKLRRKLTKLQLLSQYLALLSSSNWIDERPFVAVPPPKFIEYHTKDD